MKYILSIYLLILIGLSSCAQNSDSTLIKKLIVTENKQDSIQLPIINPIGTTLETRINTPVNFVRLENTENSYASYLRNLPLKPNGAEVMYYDGTHKSNNNVYDAVIDLTIGTRNLHQCADAVMRLWAEYLWTNKRYDDIHFNFTNGFRIEYSKWIQGYRIKINGNKVSWYKSTSPSNTYKDFWKYMELVFSYAGTLSLSKELIPVPKNEMKIGDVFIWGGSPGHAILVIDMAINPETKERVFLLAQSYMPAQETQILKNQNNSTISPWYSLSDLKTELKTPEWNFYIDHLKRFK
jgi:hypothetical protein